MQSGNNSMQIASKNLSILDDQMTHEALASRKSTTYSQYFTDPTLKNFASQLAQHHRQQFECLLQYLNRHN